MEKVDHNKKGVLSEYSAFYEEMDRLSRESDDAYMELGNVINEMKSLEKSVQDSQISGVKIERNIIEKMHELLIKKIKLSDKIKESSEKITNLYGTDSYLKQSLLKDDLPHANA